MVFNTSNERRSELKKECRKALSDHIFEKLKLRVPPSRVRLQPSKEDGYAWSALSSKQYLLEKNLASCTGGRCADIMDELGKSLEAVFPISTLPKNETRNDRESPIAPDISHVETESFTVIISELKDKNERLTIQLERCQKSLQDVTCNYQKERTKARNMTALLVSLSSTISKLKEPFYESKRYMDKAAAEILDIDQQLDSSEGEFSVETSTTSNT